MADALDYEHQEAGFVYRWINQNDKKARPAIYAGWDPVEGKAVESLSKAAQQILGQTTDNPGGGSLIRRGDVILMRMPRDLHEEKIARPRREARERQAASVDTMVAATNERARRQMRSQGLRNIPTDMAFTSSDDAKFGQLKDQKG
jgi:hypothetical protein